MCLRSQRSAERLNGGKVVNDLRKNANWKKTRCNTLYLTFNLMQSFQIRANALIFICLSVKCTHRRKNKPPFRCCYRTLFFVMGTHFKSNWPLAFCSFLLVSLCFASNWEKQNRTKKFKYEKTTTTTLGVTKSHDCHIITNRLEHIPRILFKNIFVYYYLAYVPCCARQILCHQMR